MKTKFNGILRLLLEFVVKIPFAHQKIASRAVSGDSGALPGVQVVIKGSIGDVLVFEYLGYKTVSKRRAILTSLMQH